MVGEHEQYLYFPLFVAIAGSLIVYLAQLWLQRITIRDALLTEIRLILNHARETLDYLSQTDHYWLGANNVLSRGPTDTRLGTNIFTELLPQAHLLGRPQVVRILHFYAHYERCENLKISLFKHIRDHVDAKTALTEKDVHLLNIRRMRLCEGYKSLLGTLERKIDNLSALPIEYDIPSTKDVAAQVNKVISAHHESVSLFDPVRKEVIIMPYKCGPEECDPKWDKRKQEEGKEPKDQQVPPKQ